MSLAGELQFGAVLQKEVVDLGVATQAIEIERLERVEPVLVERRVAQLRRWGTRRRVSATTPATAATGGSSKAGDDVGHLVLRQRDDFGELGDVVKLGCAQAVRAMALTIFGGVISEALPVIGNAQRQEVVRVECTVIRVDRHTQRHWRNRRCFGAWHQRRP